MSLLGFPLLLITFAVYNIVAFLMPGVAWTGTLFSVHMVSDADWSMSASDLLITLAILLLAGEILRLKQGQLSLTATWPWMVAFCFGLLHGLGFASALIDIGLPQSDIPLALFGFNVGVELGQLGFIAAVLALAWSLERLLHLQIGTKEQLRTATTYIVGTIAAFWFLETLMAFWT